MRFLVKQGAYALAGAVLLAFFARTDYQRWRLFAPTLLVAALGLCVLVLAIGPAINGARRWFLLGRRASSHRTRQAGRVRLGVRLPRPPARAADARRAAQAHRPRRRGLRRADPRAARPGHDDLPRPHGGGRAPRLRAAVAAPGSRRGARRSPSGRGDLARAVPTGASLRLPRPDAGPGRRRLPVAAGGDRDRLRRAHRQRPGRGRAEDQLPARGAHGHDLRRRRQGWGCSARSASSRGSPRSPGLATGSRCAAATRSANGLPWGSRRSSAARRRSISPPCSALRRSPAFLFRSSRTEGRRWSCSSPRSASS